ncbi:MAG: T9SS type A sorting domain-containing protein, partial [Bacteroidales bacterium]|nr:T9SS type A sorting domain-containing protein [Bacteroidales bacterium]
WLKHGGGDWEDHGADICIDHNYVYVVGTYRDQISIGDTVLNSAGTMDVLLVKYDLNGGFQWAESAGGVNEDKGKSITSDDSGNVVITGDINYIAKFGEHTVPYVGFSDMFVAKYNGDGVCQWATSGGGSIWDGGECVEIAKNGDVIVAGYFNDQAVFDTITVSGIDYADVFIARYSSDGAVQEVASAGGSGGEIIQCLAIDSLSNVYISGWYMDNITIGGEKHYSSGVYDIFIAKYKPNSGFIWSKSIGGYGSDEARGMVLSPDNNILLSGMFEESVDFGLKTLNSDGWSDGFVAQIDTSGSLDWIIQLGGTGMVDVNDCVSDLNGNLYIAGNFLDELIIAGESFSITGGMELFLAKLNESASGIAENTTTLNSGCYPNPFINTLNFFYTINSRTDVRLSLYNSSGHLVVSRIEKGQFAGKHLIELSGSKLSAGIYFYSLETKEGRSTGKMIKL